MNMVEPKFENHAALVDALWHEIKTNGLYDSSKIDFYDFVLYLLNKYDKNHFFNTNDNADNERLLKVNATKIKAAKKNISVKFMSEAEYKDIFVEFLRKIGNGNLPSLDDTGNSYTMVIEDPALRSVLETKLKRVANTTLDYKMNKEIVTISHESFLKMLAFELDLLTEDKDSAGIETLLSNTIDSLKDDKSKQVIKQSIQEAIKTLKDSDSIQSFGINSLKAVATFAVTKFMANAPTGN
jgi:hypothetical protein